MPNDLLRQTEAAKMLNVTRQYINGLVTDNKVKSYTSAKLVSQKEIKQFVENSRKSIDKVKQS